ncbi:MAG: GAF domain-containing protein [Actinobacteria bacterium]|nr:MAG: GAF domain-containing protein [Actinomycetota bacterium]
MDIRQPKRGTVTGAIVAVTVLVLLYLARTESYLLFHSIAELFAIVVSACVFMVIWNSRRFVQNEYLLFLGVASLAIACVDAAHLFTYKGMGILPGTSLDTPTQLWIAARSMQAIALVIAPGMLGRGLDLRRVAAGWTLAVMLVFATIFWWRVFPHCLDATGLTGFKIGAEYVISALFITAMVLLRRNAERFQPNVLRLLFWSLAVTVASELCFTLYSDAYGLLNLIGHYTRILAVYLLYKAIIETALTEPNAVLFRELAQANTALSERESRIRREAELAQTLGAIDAEVSSTLDLDEILRRALLGAAEAVHADSAAISLREDDGWRVSHIYQLPADSLGRLLDEVTGRHLFFAAESNTPLMVRNALADPRVDAGLATRLGISGVLTVPLSSAGRVFGILSFHLKSVDREFRDTDREFAMRLATSLALAFENARQYAAQREIADTLQGAMLSFPDRLPGVELGHAYRSADELAKIGGDFYDAFEIDEHRVAIVLGDVAGKGISAAATSSIVRTTLHAFSLIDATPSEVLASANEALVRLLPDGIFATATYAVIDTRTGLVDLCSAGHPDPYVCTSTGCARHDALRNGPLGIWPDVAFEQFRIMLHPGDAFIIFSDGLPDARRDKEFFGEDRIYRTLDALRDAGPQSIVDTLMAEVIAFSRDVHTDDIAIVAASLTQRQ